ncbi:MAG: hypothetical protein A2725_02175 [Candidatus Magasanikbacteria bacterium RIFCSPHIGHO2_01_FULL_33_34]|uniref:Uncharacterized protein n=1 Tax=Candidatus Magasanikbacteria bacterium RIFCSPHIGHO2_01_FULL_33_34 TaxID=1798671 RepID=A0A1F6LK78_9BACT|nr:MAG: hypothetical protein A2725_02175 [Candidatus Magasanikbacteria bacterium RIFCSPHIGHO2_01_FULL_33_34]OGH65575.1 MAG: hypothetical protein A3B83_01750 [Candidatus Magasanikbacteria bacterium RIFCSPHIGHO2_02_FULL_33_17]OGH76285.1 MAG: hypothetical protein A3A89_02570 [Candidatus Magasanikbacteria bacterium RIFCSPLOWO2_01_FULL_33_34]OGH81520.1 MAG: hypothetical protein A3F93_01005 [Candidatus Magasanikbacteria bacterium RIFCSPLOWO2_12_FULL_34_7]
MSRKKGTKLDIYKQTKGVELALTKITRYLVDKNFLPTKLFGYFFGICVFVPFLITKRFLSWLIRKVTS